MSLPRNLHFSAGLERLVGESDRLTARLETLSTDIRMTLTVRTRSGEPLQHQRGRLSRENFEDFAPRADAYDAAVAAAEKAGLTIVHRGEFGIIVSGPLDLIQDLCRTDLVVNARPRPSNVRATLGFAANFDPPQDQDLFIAPRTSLSIGSRLDEAIDHMVFTPPPIYFEPSATPPDLDFFHLGQADIRRLLDVPTAPTGKGITVAIVDSGFHPHPFYRDNNFDFRGVPTPSDPDPESDVDGHGTAISFNAFAVAPGVSVRGYKRSDPPEVALEKAAADRADIISCSWGFDREEIFPSLQASLLRIINNGVVVVCASGNNGVRAWPASQPEVISVGGVYADHDDRLEVSNFASGFNSDIFNARSVPDVSGLCGQKPEGVYIAMPTQPDSIEDWGKGAYAYPDGDGTGGKDGWVVMSGTSAATPQVAGVVALMLEKARQDGRSLGPGRIKDILRATATPVTRGRNANGRPGDALPNGGAGAGLVNASRALSRV